MRNVTVKQAEADLEALIEAAGAGEEVVIAREGGPAVRLVVVEHPGPGRRPLGTVPGDIWIGPDFDDPLPEDMQAAFEGRGP